MYTHMYTYIHVILIINVIIIIVITNTIIVIIIITRRGPHDAASVWWARRPNSFQPRRDLAAQVAADKPRITCGSRVSHVAAVRLNSRASLG